MDFVTAELSDGRAFRVNDTVELETRPGRIRGKISRIYAKGNKYMAVVRWRGHPKGDILHHNLETLIRVS